MVKFGPTSDLLDSKGRSLIFNPDIRYSEAPVSSAIYRLRSTPSPRIEKGLMGVEKSPFLGIKYENDNPNCWPNAEQAESISISIRNNTSARTLPNQLYRSILLMRQHLHPLGSP